MQTCSLREMGEEYEEKKRDQRGRKKKNLRKKIKS